jgi:predicted transcriptional regulator
VKLITLGNDYAFVKRDDEYIGIVSLVNIMKDGSVSKLTEFMEPLFFIKADEQKLKTTVLMKENNVEHIAVTNQAEEFVVLLQPNN